MLEKVHGSCFCIATDSVSIRCGKRREWIDDSYHDVSAVLQKYGDALRSLHAGFGVAPGSVLYVFGELYGGSGEDAVQTEIVYCDQIDFVVFDVFFDNVFVDYDRVIRVCRDAGVPVLEPIFTGQLNQCLDFNVEKLTSAVAARHGHGGSAAEGIVVKCSKEISVETAKGKKERAVAKKKSQRFREAVQNRCERGKELIHLKGFVTRNRLVNVTSKMGKIRSRKDQKLCARLVEDLISDAMEEAALGDVIMAEYLGSKEKRDKASAAIRQDAERIVEEWSNEQK